MSFALEPQFPTQNSEPNSKSFFALEPTLTKEREQRPPPEPPPPPATPFEADPARRGRKAFEELRTPSPSPPPRPGANEGLRLGASEPSLPPATTPREDRASLDLLIRSELPGLVRKAVEDYCASHFSQLAREVLLTEIRRLAEEKARHLAD